MTWEGDIENFITVLRARQLRLHTEVANRIHASITHGSATTGAPGQPVQTGNLINSWKIIRFSPFQTQISTSVVYAPGIEDGESGGVGTSLQLRSEVGGFHSVKMTRAGFQDLVNEVVRQV